MSYINGRKTLSISGIQQAAGGVTSLGGATGDITLGNGLSIENNELSASGGGSTPTLVWSGSVQATNGIPTELSSSTLFTKNKKYLIEIKANDSYSYKALIEAYCNNGREINFFYNFMSGAYYTTINISDDGSKVWFQPPSGHVESNAFTTTMRKYTITNIWEV